MGNVERAVGMFQAEANIHRVKRSEIDEQIRQIRQEADTRVAPLLKAGAEEDGEIEMWDGFAARVAQENGISLPLPTLPDTTQPDASVQS